jgi:hypothetical protein
MRILNGEIVQDIALFRIRFGHAFTINVNAYPIFNSWFLKVERPLLADGSRLGRYIGNGRDTWWDFHSEEEFTTVLKDVLNLFDKHALPSLNNSTSYRTWIPEENKLPPVGWYKTEVSMSQDAFDAMIKVDDYAMAVKSTECLIEYEKERIKTLKKLLEEQNNRKIEDWPCYIEERTKSAQETKRRTQRNIDGARDKIKTLTEDIALIQKGQHQKFIKAVNDLETQGKKLINEKFSKYIICTESPKNQMSDIIPPAP